MQIELQLTKISAVGRISVKAHGLRSVGFFVLNVVSLRIEK
jgi:hypothetical protein